LYYNTVLVLYSSHTLRKIKRVIKGIAYQMLLIVWRKRKSWLRNVNEHRRNTCSFPNVTKDITLFQPRVTLITIKDKPELYDVMFCCYVTLNTYVHKYIHVHSTNSVQQGCIRKGTRQYTPQNIQGINSTYCNINNKHIYKYILEQLQLLLFIFTIAQ
jgi:hypothetical protein